MTTNSAGGGIDVRWWVGFCRAHLHDYSPAAARFWLALALIGTSAAVLAAGIEALIAASRSSSRLSSRVASLCAAAIGMTIGGSLLDIAQPWLQDHGLPHAAAHLAALAVAVLAYFVLSTTTLMQIVCLKRGMRLTPQEWFDRTSWV